MKQIPRSAEIDRATLFALNWLRTYVDTEIAAIPGGGGGGVTDHGLLTGLADDDHPQYLNNARGDARYEALGAVSTHVAASDPHVQYQKESEKGAASGYASLDGSVKVPIAQLPTGTGAGTVALGDDARFTDTRTPTDNTVSTVKLQNNAVDNTKLADMATSRIKGRVTAATGDPEDLTPTQVTAMLDVATTTLKGLMSSADKTKLDGVATGATANATDAALRDRSTHTGTQASSTVTAAATSRLLGRLTAGAGAVEELTGTQATTLLDVATTSVKGVMSAADKTKLDGIATGATANATDAALRDRSTHTGTQASSTVTAAATSRLLGRVTAGAGAVEELTGTQATTLLDTFTSALQGLAPASGGGTTNFLRADGAWAAPPGGGGGGSPGGLTTHVQYNNAGVFDGAANVLIDASEELVIPTKVAFTDRVMSSAPASAGTNTVNFFEARIGRRNMAVKDQYGMTHFYGGIDGLSHPAAWYVSTGTTVDNTGMPPTHVGTVSTPTIGTSSIQAGTRRWQVASATTANAIAETYSTVSHVFRGDAGNRGGFFMAWSAAPAGTFAALQRGFFGLVGATAATSTTQSPSAQLNCIGFGWDSSQTTLRLMHNDGAGVCTTVDLGVNFPSTATTDLYDFFLYCPKVGTEVRWACRRRSTDDWAEGVITTDLPATTQVLSPKLWTNNGGTAAAATFACSGLVLEYVP